MTESSATHPFLRLVHCVILDFFGAAWWGAHNVESVICFGLGCRLAECTWTSSQLRQSHCLRYDANSIKNLKHVRWRSWQMIKLRSCRAMTSLPLDASLQEHLGSKVYVSKATLLHILNQLFCSNFLYYTLPPMQLYIRGIDKEENPVEAVCRLCSSAYMWPQPCCLLRQSAS